MRLWVAVGVVVLLAGCSGPASGPAPTGSACIPSGTEASINAALHGPGAMAELCSGAVFDLHAPVTFTAANQTLRTQGLPSGDDRAKLIVDTPTLTTAIKGVGISGIVVENVRVDGSRTRFGPLAGDALLELGGVATGQTVRDVDAGDTRSWSTLHLFEGTATGGVPGCQRAVVTGNAFGPAGEPDGTWADGISLACGNSTVTSNVIHDATDAAIAIFGAPGSTIAHNTIEAVNRPLLGGIAMDDFAPFDGNFEGTTVISNDISTLGPLIKVGIGMGQQVWTCKPGTNHGATVTGNTVRGDHVGYSFPVAGVKNWIVTGNHDEAKHTGLLPGYGCGGMPASPGGFQYQDVTASNLQSGYTPAKLTYVLGVYEPGSLAIDGCNGMMSEQLLPAGHTIASCSGQVSLQVTASGQVTLSAGATVLWTAPAAGVATLEVQANGDLEALGAAQQVLWSAGTAGHPSARLTVQDGGNLVLYDVNDQPLWATNTALPV
jgi:hypothetical protein